jgi:hypothetical protein
MNVIGHYVASIRPSNLKVFAIAGTATILLRMLVTNTI